MCMRFCSELILFYFEINISETNSMDVLVSCNNQKRTV